MRATPARNSAANIEKDVLGMRSRNGKNRTPSSKFRGAISNELSGSAANEAEEKTVSD